MRNILRLLVAVLAILLPLQALDAGPVAPRVSSSPDAKASPATREQQPETGAPDAPSDGAVPEISIQQIVGHGSAITIYADVADALADPASAAKDALSVDPATVTVNGVRSLNDTDHTAYIVLLDVSASTRRQAEQLHQALDRWINAMGADDQMAIVTFGDGVSIKQDFTSDKNALLTASVVRPTDQRTHLFEAIMKAAELAGRRDDGLPDRRAILVVGDGINDDDKSGFKEEDVLHAVGQAGVPVFALDSGQARLGSPTQCAAFPNRISALSNGHCFPVANQSLDQIFAAIEAAMRRVAVIDSTCSSCRPDGIARSFALRLTADHRILTSAKRDVIIEPAKPRGTWWLQWPWWLLWLGILLAIGLAIAVIVLRRRKESPEPVRDTRPPPTTPPVTVAVVGVVEPKSPEMPVVARLEFVVVGGPHSGTRYSAALRNRIVVGSATDCDIAIVDDAGVAEQQCEITCEGADFFITNLAPESPMVVKGGQLHGTRRIKHWDTFVVGSSTLRFVVLEDVEGA